MRATAEVLAPYKGCYVRLAAQTRRCTFFSKMGPEPIYEYSPWVEKEIEGLVTSIPYLNGNRLGDETTLRVFGVESLWVQPWDSITHICQECQHKHPLPRMLAEARVLTECDSTCAKDRKCSLCGSVSNQRMVVPYKYRWIGKSTPHETVEKELVSLIFQRKMTDWNAKFAVIETTRQSDYSRGRRQLLKRYVSRLTSDSGEPFSAHHDEPLPTGAWERWLDLQDIKTMCSKLTAGGETIWSRDDEAV